MVGDSESRFGFLAGLVACVLILALTMMAFAPGAPSVLQTPPEPPIKLEAPSLPLSKDAPPLKA